VIASDIPVLRESGGNGANFATVADIDAWVETVLMVFNAKPRSVAPEYRREETAQDAASLNSSVTSVPSLETRLAWAATFSWAEHARIIAEAYQKLL